MWKGRYAECRRAFDAFFKAEIVPSEPRFLAEITELQQSANPWRTVPVIEELKKKAKAANLWNLFLPSVSGLTQYEYAQLAEVMGTYIWSTEAFNCDAPDTGNMETLHLFGSEQQKRRYLVPLLEGTIRSAFLMTEPRVASSDATNLETMAVRQGDDYVINGRKWFASGFGHPHCELLIVVVCTDKEAAPHKRHTMLLVPKSTPGVIPIRPMKVFGNADAPHGHWEVDLKNVRVPAASSILIGEGKGFAIAQGRLGPGRVHHCMRSIGMAERALSMLIERASQRVAFGRPLALHGMTQEQIAESRLEIDQARLLVLHCAKTIDTKGTRAAFQQIAMIKVAAPRAACRVIDRAIQVHGGMGVTQDSQLTLMYAGQRALRLADGPDEVHITTIAKAEMRKLKKPSKL